MSWGEFSKKVREQAKIRAAGKCELCGFSLEGRATELDHVLPRTRGGPSTLANASVLCRLCHKIKTADDRRRERVRRIKLTGPERRALDKAAASNLAAPSPLTPKPRPPDNFGPITLSAEEYEAFSNTVVDILHSGTAGENGNVPLDVERREASVAG